MNDRYRLLLSFTSAGYAAVCFTVASCVGTDHFPEIFDTVCGDGVMHPFSLFVVIYKSAVRKDLHVMRKSRLCDIQFLQQITSALFSMLESKHDRKAVLIRERLYFFNVFSESHDFHLREMYILYHTHLQLSMYEYNIVSKSSPPLMGVWEPFSDIYLTATTPRHLTRQLNIVTSIKATQLSHFSSRIVLG